jgi:hypothetical protein
MQVLIRINRLPPVMNIASAITVVCGVLLLWKLSDGFQSAWMSSKQAMILSMSGGLAIIAWFIGFFVNLPIVTRINRMGKTIAGQSSPPSPEQLQQLIAWRGKLFAATKLSAALLALTVIVMNIVKYF